MEFPPVLTRLRKRLRRDRIEVDLDVVEQLVIGRLLRVKSALAQDLRDHVLAQRATANAQQVSLSLVRLQSLRLIQRVDPAPGSDEPTDPPPNGRRYRITGDGKRLRVVIPAEPRSTIHTRV